MNRVVLFLFAFLGVIHVFGQFEYDIRTYGEESGFYDTDEVSDIHVDSEGYVWIVSFSRITRYDGLNFNSISVDHTYHNGFYKFVERSNDVPYVVDLDGRVHTIKNDSIHLVEESEIVGKLKSTKIPPSVFFDDENNFHYSLPQYGSTYIGVYTDSIIKPLLNKEEKFNGLVCIPYKKRKQLFLVRDSIYDNLNFDLNFYLLDSNFNVLDKSIINRGANKYRHRPICLNFKGKEAYSIISTGRGEVVELKNGKIHKIRNWNKNISMFNDNDLGTWISSYKDGIYYYKDYENQTEATEHLFEGQQVIAFDQDIDANIWIYSKEIGLASISTRYKVKKNNQGEKIEAIEILDSNLYYSKESGVLVEENIFSNEYTQIDISSLEQNNNGISEVFSILADKEKIWVAKRKGVYSYDGEKWIGYNINDLLNLEFDGSRFHFGNVFPKKNSEVIAFKYKTYLELNHYSKKILSKVVDEEVNSAVKVSNFSYLGTNNGLYIIENFEDQSETIERDIVGKNIDKLTFFDGKLFFTVNDNAVFFRKNDTIKELLYEGYSLKNSFFETDSNFIWIYSSVGTFKLNVGEELIVKSNAYEPILLNSIINVQQKNNFLFLLNNRGIIKYKLDEIEKYPIETTEFYINQIVVNDSILISNRNDFFTLKHFQNFIEFKVRAISFKKNKVEYRYRLLGISTRWVKSNVNLMRYSSLSSGKYVFEIQARTGDLPWSKSKKVKFEILKPFYQEWWFILLLSLFFLTSIYLILLNKLMRDRIKKDLIIDNLKAEQRALRAQIDPHFIFNIISSAQYFILKQETKKANQFLNHFSRLLRGNLKHAGFDMISIKDEIELLTDYIKLEQQRLEHTFEYSIIKKFVRKSDDEHIPQFLIQPFVENAINHGLKSKKYNGKLTVMFFLLDEYIQVVIEDNGIGYQKAINIKEQYSKSRKSYGIDITKERLKLFNTDIDKPVLEIIDLGETTVDKKGTRVILYIKRSKNESSNN